MLDNEDLTIYYFGGSGGFFLLYMLLLTKQYQCIFEDGTADAFSQKSLHWNISDVSKWKNSEKWPSNIKTLGSTFSTRKIYFVCNPDPICVLPTANNKNNLRTEFPSNKILLYTDLKTQWYMAKTKRAYWFQQGWSLDGSGSVWKTPEFINEQFCLKYKKVKHSDWPDCSHMKDFYNLPVSVQEYCIKEYNFWELLDYDKFDNSDYFPPGVVYNNSLVYKRAVDFMDKVDIVVKLQDVISTKGLELFNQIGVSTTADVSKFLLQYLSLHTIEQRNYLLGKT
jgi:hypothetical protein